MVRYGIQKIIIKVLQELSKEYLYMKDYKKLSLQEIDMIEKIYDYNFPDEFIHFLSEDFHIYKGQYDWKDFSNDNIQEIKKIIHYPVEYLRDNILEIEWNERWGAEPLNAGEKNKKIKEQLALAPQLFPVFAHRYIPIINHRNPPVLSIHGSDVIYYGKNYKQYIRKEKKDFLRISFNIKQCLYIPFWTDIM